MNFRLPLWLPMCAIVLAAVVVEARPRDVPQAAVPVDPAAVHAAAAVAKEAKASYEKKAFVVAAEQFRRAFALDPSRPERLYGAGLALQHAGNVQESREVLEMLRRLLASRHPLQAKAAAALVAMQEVVADPVVVIPSPARVAPEVPVAALVTASPCAVPTPPEAHTELPRDPTCAAQTFPERVPDFVTMGAGGLLMAAGAALAIWADHDRRAQSGDSGGLQAAESRSRTHSVSILAIVSATVGAGALAVGWYGRAPDRMSPTLTASRTSVGLAWRF